MKLHRAAVASFPRIGGFTSKSLIACTVLAVCGIASPARAGLTITPTFDSSITTNSHAAAIESTINSAIAIYEAKFTDNVNVTIKFSDMSSGLGQSTWNYFRIDYSTYLNALIADKTTSNDTTALSILAPSGLPVPGGTTNPVTGDALIDVKPANMHAVGLSAVPSIGFDGLIGLNTSITDVNGGLYSLLTVTEHEIDEVMGLGSGLNISSADLLPEDLFRYDSTGARNFTQSSSATSFFSIDGVHDLAQFNQTGIGDFGDWNSDPRAPGVPPQVQDAFATPGASPALGVELTALDVIGWDLAPSTNVVPEPASLIVFGGLGLLFAAGSRRRSRRQSSTESAV